MKAKLELERTLLEILQTLKVTGMIEHGKIEILTPECL